MKAAIAAASGSAFRVIHISEQTNHVHLIVEARDARALSSGMLSLGVRMARAINRVLQISGSVWKERYHARALETPREVRNAIVYVLMNAKKHGVRLTGLDRFSSAQWFDGFAELTPAEEPPTAAPKTWLAREGWRKHGLLRVHERPRPT